jgi:hypothetical protein
MVVSFLSLEVRDRAHSFWCITLEVKCVEGFAGTAEMSPEDLRRKQERTAGLVPTVLRKKVFREYPIPSVETMSSGR